MKQTILVADDEDLFRQTIVDALNESGRDVAAVGVSNGAAALAYLIGNRVDILVTDLQMPEMDGVALLKEVLNRGFQPAVIVMTAHGTPEIERWSTSHLAFAVFEKPLDILGLLGAIQRLLEPEQRGHLEGITLPGLCQLLHIEQKTCEVRVKSQDRAGRLIFRRGDLIDAVHEDAVGDPAALDILSWTECRADIRSTVPSSGSMRVTRGLTFLLMEAARIFDEASAKELPGGARITLRPPGSWMPPALDAATGWGEPSVVPSIRPHARRGSSGTVKAVAIPSTVALAASSEMQGALATLVQLAGFVAAAVVDTRDGVIVASSSLGTIDLALFARKTADVVRARQSALNQMGVSENLEDDLVTLGNQYHLVRPLAGHGGLFLFLVLRREAATLALARRSLGLVASRIASAEAAGSAPAT